MGISRITCMEIFTNAKDLDFVVGEHNGKFAISISRGPGHGFKPLLSTENVFESRQTAIDVVKGVLEGIQTEMEKEFSTPGAIGHDVFNPDSRSIKEAQNVLHQPLIDEICTMLATHGRARTYE